MSSAICFNLDQSKYLLSGNELIHCRVRAISTIVTDCYTFCNKFDGVISFCARNMLRKWTCLVMLSESTWNR